MNLHNQIDYTTKIQQVYNMNKTTTNKTVRLTPENVTQYIGHDIIFKTRGNHVVKRILGVNVGRASVRIDHNDMNNVLKLTHGVFVLIE